VVEFIVVIYYVSALISMYERGAITVKETALVRRLLLFEMWCRMPLSLVIPFFSIQNSLFKIVENTEKCKQIISEIVCKDIVFNIFSPGLCI